MKWGKLTMKDLIKDKTVIARLIRQASKWIKNTVAIRRILQNIVEQEQGCFRKPFDYFLDFYKMGPKTVALLFYAAFGELTVVPVVSHVMETSTILQWTNAKTEEEAAWQFQYTVHKSINIQINGAVGAIGQVINEGGQDEMLQIAKADERELIEKNINGKQKKVLQDKQGGLKLFFKQKMEDNSKIETK